MRLPFITLMKLGMATADIIASTTTVTTSSIKVKPPIELGTNRIGLDWLAGI